MGLVTLVFSIVAYLAFFASFLYLIVFIGGDMLGFIGAPKTIDSGPSQWPAAPAAMLNILLLLLFGVQHSVMARGGFKKAWTKIIPKQMERSTFVLATVIVLVVLYYGWRPMPHVIWSIESPLWAGVLMALFFVGIGMVLVSTFLINHFELFGLSQGWARFKNKDMSAPRFVTPWLYKLVRHPMYLGLLIAFWSTSHMTAGHLLFAAIWSAYILIGIGYEERDLIEHLGDPYREYHEKIPMILPFGGRK